LGPNEGQNKEMFDKYLKNVLLINHRAECIDIAREHHWGKEIQVCSNEVPGITKGHALKGRSFI